MLLELRELLEPPAACCLENHIRYCQFLNTFVAMETG